MKGHVNYLESNRTGQQETFRYPRRHLESITGPRTAGYSRSKFQVHRRGAGGCAEYKKQSEHLQGKALSHGALSRTFSPSARGE